MDPATTQAKLSKLIPFVENMTLVDDKATGYVCVNFACQRPTNDLKTLEEQLDNTVK